MIISRVLNVRLRVKFYINYINFYVFIAKAYAKFDIKKEFDVKQNPPLRREMMLYS